MIDNIEILKPILNFQNKGDFYMLYILKRKKDQPKDSMTQNVRMIKRYCINSIDYLDSRYEEIKTLCKVFNARAYIKVVRNNHNDVGMELIKEVANSIQKNQVVFTNIFGKVVGNIKAYDKRWIVDIDTKDENTVQKAIDTIDKCKPVGSKLIAKVPTKNGFHLITSRFDIVEFKKQHPQIDIQKTGPTVLYSN